MTERNPLEEIDSQKFSVHKCAVCNGFGTLSYGKKVCHGCNGKGYVVINNDTGMPVERETDDNRSPN
jgi:DnaJ-class molecular chaperone